MNTMEVTDCSAHEAPMAAASSGRAQAPLHAHQGNEQRHTKQAKRGLSKAGWLMSAPGSWLRLFIRQLPPTDRLALFQTCRPLAKEVMHSVHNVKLCIGHPNDPKPTTTLQARSGILYAILTGCSDIRLVLHTSTSKPLPQLSGISGRVTQVSLEGRWWDDSYLSCNRDWGSMQSLHSVSLQQGVRLQDISQLSDAVEAGQLPKLRSMALLVEDFHGGYTKVQAALLRFAKSAGKQLVHLDTNCRDLLEHLGHFSVLRSVTVQRYLSKEAMQQLCSHPTLQSVTIQSGQSTLYCGSVQVEGDHRALECSWESITFHGIGPKVIPLFPLNHVERIIVSHATPFAFGGGDGIALQEVLASHASKLGCVPSVKRGGDVFCLTRCLPSELQLLQHLKCVHKLYIASMSKPTDYLPHLYKVLPPCIHTIAMDLDWHLADYRFYWRDLPQHVLHLQLSGLNFRFKDLMTLVTTAPAHVRKLTLRWRYELIEEKVRPGSSYEALLSVAPAHLSVVATSWR